MYINSVKLEITGLVLKTQDESLLLDCLKILKSGPAASETKSFGNKESGALVHDLNYPYLSADATLEEKKRLLREALEEGEKAKMVEDFDLEGLLKDLHRDHL